MMTGCGKGVTLLSFFAIAWGTGSAVVPELAGDNCCMPPLF